MSWRCRIPTWKARQLQEAAEVIPTLQQQSGDVIGARVYERLRVLVRQRRRSPSSHCNSHLGQSLNRRIRGDSAGAGVGGEALASGGMMKRLLGICVALLVALGAGWVWGASRQSDLNRALRIAELRDALLEGRATVLDARLDIYSVNFGEASRHLEAARTALRAAEARLNSLDRQADTKPLDLALEDRRCAAHGRSAQSGCEPAGGRGVESDQRRAQHHREALTRG